MEYTVALFVLLRKIRQYAILICSKNDHPIDCDVPPASFTLEQINQRDVLLY